MFTKHSGDCLVERGQSLADIDHKEHEVGRVEGTLDLLVDVAFEVVRVNDAVTARIDKLEVMVVFFDYCDYPVARNARRGFDYAYHSARQSIEQARFAHVGPANYRYYR